jgi:hypothetical protein
MVVAGSCSRTVQQVLRKHGGISSSYCNLSHPAPTPSSLPINARFSSGQRGATGHCDQLGSCARQRCKCRRLRLIPVEKLQFPEPTNIQKLLNANTHGQAVRIDASSERSGISKEEVSVIDDFLEESWEAEQARRATSPVTSEYDDEAEEALGDKWDFQDQLPFDLNQLPFDLKGFFDPSPDNLLAVVFTSILAFIVLQLAWQFLLIIVSIAFFSLKYAVLGLILAIIIVYTV